MLKQAFSEFSVSEEEGLHKGYDRFQKILSQLNQMQAKPDNDDVNIKFLKALPPSWSQVALTLKTRGGIEYLSFDDLYNKLRSLEIDVKGGLSYGSRSTTVAPTYSAFIDAASTNTKMMYSDKPSYSSLISYTLVPSGSIMKDILHYFVAKNEPTQQLAYEDFEQAGRNINFNNKDSVRFDRRKARCYNCLQLGHFVRECNVKKVDEKARYSAFKISETKEAEQVYGLMDGFESDFVVPAGNAAGGVNPVVVEFAMMGISPKVQTCPFRRDSELSDLKKNYEHLEKLYNDSFIQVQAHKNTVKTLELQKDWYHQTQLALEEKVRILSANLENITNTLKYSKTLYDQAKIEKQEWEINDKSSASETYDFASCVSSPKTNDSFSAVDVKPLPKSDVKDQSLTNDLPSCSFKENVKPPRNLCNKSETADRIPCKNTFVRTKKCFVCGSKSHLIKDCNVHDTVDNFLSIVSKTAYVPAGSRNSLASISAGRYIPAGRRTRSASIHAGQSILAASRNRSASIHAGLTSQHLFPLVHPHMNKDIGIIDSGCSRSMTDNKEKLDDFVQVRGGTVTYGGGDGKITGRGTIRTSKLDFENVYYVEELQNFNPFSVSQICDKKNKVLFIDSECLVLTKEFQLPNESQVVLQIPRRHDLYNFNLSDIQPEQHINCLLAKASLEESTKWHRRMTHVNFKTINKLAKHGLVEGLPLKLFTNEHNCVACNREKQHKASYKAISAAARSMFADSKLPTMFWTEAVSTTCYVLNRVSITNPHNKTPYELLSGKVLNIRHLKPFGRQVTILNASDHLRKFKGKANDGFLVGYAAHSKAYRVYNLSSKKVEEMLNLRYLEDKPSVQGLGQEWYFDLDYLTDSLSYTRFKTNPPAGTHDTNILAGTQADDSDSKCDEQVILVPSFPSNSFSGPTVHDVLAPIENNLDYAKELARLQRQECEAHSATMKHGFEFSVDTAALLPQAEIEIHRNLVPAAGVLAGSIVPASGVSAGSVLASSVSAGSVPASSVPTGGVLAGSIISVGFGDPAASASVPAVFTNAPAATSPLPPGHSLGSYEHTTRFPSPFDLGNHQPSADIFSSSSYDDDFYADVTNLASNVAVNPVTTKRVNIIHPQSQIIVALQLVAQGHRQEEGIDYDEVFAPVARIEAIRLFLAIASYMGFMVYQMDVKSAFLYGEIEEEVYVTQPKGFEDPHNPKHVYRVVKALYGLHQAPRACQDKYVMDMLKKFDMESMRTATTPYEVPKHKSKDDPDDAVNVYLFRSMIGSLMYLTASRPDIMFAMSACSIHQLKAYSDSDYEGSYGDRKSTTGGCQFLGRRLISWQCKKQTVVATSSTEAEYVATASCCGQVFVYILPYFLSILSCRMNAVSCGLLLYFVSNVSGYPKLQVVQLYYSYWQLLVHADEFVPAGRCTVTADDHNKVAYLEKRKGWEAYEQILNFLTRSHIRYALTHRPTIVFDSLVKHLWATATVRTLEAGPSDIIATIDGNEVVVTESLIRTQLQLDDVNGLYEFTLYDVLDGMRAIGDGADAAAAHDVSPPPIVPPIHSTPGPSSAPQVTPVREPTPVRDPTPMRDPIPVRETTPSPVREPTTDFPRPPSPLPRTEDVGLTTSTKPPSPTRHTFVHEDISEGGGDFVSSPLSNEAPQTLAATAAGGAKDSSTLTALSLKLDMCLHKRLEGLLQQRKRRLVLSDSEGEDTTPTEQNIDLEALHTLARTSLGGDSSDMPAGHDAAAVPADISMPFRSPSTTQRRLRKPFSSFTSAHVPENVPAGAGVSAAATTIPAGSSVDVVVHAASATSSSIPTAADKGKAPMVDDYLPADILSELERILKNLHDAQLGEELSKKIYAEQEAEFARQQEERSTFRPKPTLDTPSAKRANQGAPQEEAGHYASGSEQLCTRKLSASPPIRTHDACSISVVLWFHPDLQLLRRLMAFYRSYLVDGVPAASSFPNDVSVHAATSSAPADLSVPAVSHAHAAAFVPIETVVHTSESYLDDPLTASEHVSSEPTVSAPTPSSSRTRRKHIAKKRVTPIVDMADAAMIKFDSDSGSDDDPLPYAPYSGWKMVPSPLGSLAIYPRAQVYMLETVDGRVIHIFVDVSYPLTVATLERMLKHGLEVLKLLVGGA
nr:ribonuclease H-like domain-containing protein [Tanacetum cinerariifolium]